MMDVIGREIILFLNVTDSITLPSEKYAILCWKCILLAASKLALNIRGCLHWFRSFRLFICILGKFLWWLSWSLMSWAQGYLMRAQNCDLIIFIGWPIFAGVGRPCLFAWARCHPPWHQGCQYTYHQGGRCSFSWLSYSTFWFLVSSWANSPLVMLARLNESRFSESEYACLM